MEWTFVLKDKGTMNQGWWLKIKNVDELCAYYEQITPTRNGKVFENYMYGKEWNCAHPSVKNDSHAPHMKEAALTDAVVRWGSQRNYNIIQSIQGFQAMVASQQLDEILETGAIYINPVGGYHGAYKGEPKYDFVKRKELIFPDFKKDNIRISQFPNGTHWYAYIGDVQVRDGDTLKWNTYGEAYQQALNYIDSDAQIEVDEDRELE